MNLSAKIKDTRERVYKRDGYKCYYCGKVGQLELAHLIAKGKDNQRIVVRLARQYKLMDISTVRARDLLNVDENLITTCSKCNSKANIGNNPVERDELIKYILDRYL